MAATCVCNLHQLMRGEGHDTFCPENSAPGLVDDSGTVFRMLEVTPSPMFMFLSPEGLYSADAEGNVTLMPNSEDERARNWKETPSSVKPPEAIPDVPFFGASEWEQANKK